VLAERGIAVSDESVRLWGNKFGPLFSKRLRRKRARFGDIFFIGKVFVTMKGQRNYLSRFVERARRLRDRDLSPSE